METEVWTVYAANQALVILGIAALGGAAVTLVVKVIRSLGGNKYEVEVEEL